jgi:hypothetical protein
MLTEIIAANVLIGKFITLVALAMGRIDFRLGLALKSSEFQPKALGFGWLC